MCLPCSTCCSAASLQAATRGVGGRPALLVPPVRGEQALLAPPSAPHCLAYLPALSQPSLVMLYGPDQAPEGQRSPGVECGKRKRQEEEEEEELVKKSHISGLEERDMVRRTGVIKYIKY